MAERQCHEGGLGAGEPPGPHVEGGKQPQRHHHDGIDVGSGLLVGALSGMLARCIIHPADTVKAQMQLIGSGTAGGSLLTPYQSTLDAVCKISQTEGLRGFYRGFTVAVVGTAPGNVAYFGGYELGRHIIPQGWGMAGDMATGAIAQLIAGAVYNPIDIVKERLQAQAVMRGLYNYRGTTDAVRSLLHTSGPAGLLKGYWVTNLAWIPWNTMYIAFYEGSKAKVAQHRCQSGNTEDLPSLCVMGCAFGSAALASLATQPVDVVKTRLQVLAAGKAGGKLTALAVAKEIWATSGWRGFTAGTVARICAIAPESAIVWLLYESMKKYVAQ